MIRSFLFSRILLFASGIVLMATLNVGNNPAVGAASKAAAEATAAATGAATLAATAPAAASLSWDDRVALFKYDAKADLNVKESGVEMQGDVAIHDITFAAFPGSDSVVKAYLVVPKGNGPFAGILWVHWLGGRATTNRTQYLKEAVSLAPKGAISLLVEGMWATSGWYNKRDPEKDYENSIRQVIELRRAMDLLMSQPNIDKARIGLVGHDYGAMYSIIAAGVDPRAKAYVFIAAAPSLMDWAYYGPQPKARKTYEAQNAALELVDYISQIKNATILFQFADTDSYVSKQQADKLFTAAAQPKETRTYKDSHSMDTKPVAADRDAWLIQTLGLSQ